MLALVLTGFGLAWPARALSQVDPPAILVSRQLAESAHLAIGDIVTLSSPRQGERSGRFRITGVYEPTPDPARLGAVPQAVRLHLPDLLDLTRDASTPAGTESVDGINIRLKDAGEAAAFSRDLDARLPGILTQPAREATEAGPFRVLERFHLAIAAVTIGAATVFLLALTIMLVDERRETVGVLRLIGLPVRRILLQVLLEGLLVALAGTVFGLALALASERLINVFFQWRYDTALVFVRITPDVAALCAAIAIPLGAGATVLASWALLRRNGLRLARR